MDFAIPELESLADLYGATDIFAPDFARRGKKEMLDVPYVWCKLPSDETAVQIMTRAILIKDIIDVCGHSFQNLDQPKPESDLEAYWRHKWQPLVDSLNGPKIKALLDQQKKFKFSFDAIGRHISMQEQLFVIQMFKGHPFKDENVSLNNAEQTFKVVENASNGEVVFGLKVAS